MHLDNDERCPARQMACALCPQEQESKPGHTVVMKRALLRGLTASWWLLLNQEPVKEQVIWQEKGLGLGEVTTSGRQLGLDTDHGCLMVLIFIHSFNRSLKSTEENPIFPQ